MSPRWRLDGNPREAQLLGAEKMAKGLVWSAWRAFFSLVRWQAAFSPFPLLSFSNRDGQIRWDKELPFLFCAITENYKG